VDASKDFLLLADDFLHLLVSGRSVEVRAGIELSLLHFARINDESRPV
jgi:hypothetical protein